MLYTYLNGDTSEKGVMIDLDIGCRVRHKEFNVEGKLLYAYRKLNRCVLMLDNHERIDTYLTSLERVSREMRETERVGQWVYEDYARKKPVWMDMQSGDRVVHKDGWSGILGVAYRKLNNCNIECSDGKTYSVKITDLKRKL